MQWTMPHRVLQIVASLIALAAVSSLIAGILGAPQRAGRLPGEKAPNSAGVGPSIEAQDATPLSNERIEGPPPPAANEEAKNPTKEVEADADDSDDNEAPGNATPLTPAQPQAGAPGPNAHPVLRPAPPTGNAPGQTLGGPPSPDDPPL